MFTWTKKRGLTPIVVPLLLLLAGCPQGSGGSHPATSIGRAEVAEAMVQLSAARVAVMQSYQMTGAWPDDDALAAMAPGVYAGDGTELRMDVGGHAGGTIALRYDPATRGWVCVAYEIPDAALPPNCRP